MIQVPEAFVLIMSNKGELKGAFKSNIEISVRYKMGHVTTKRMKYDNIRKFHD